MKPGWKLKTLCEVADFENGDRGENYPSKAFQTNSGIPFINAGHLEESGINFETMNYISEERYNLLGQGKISSRDILFCLRGSLGKFASVGDISEGAIASSLVIIRPKENVSNEFVLHYLASNLCAEMVNKFKTGTAQPNLAASSLKKFIIPVPPLSEQQRIVSILDKAFEGIATAKANAEKNLQNARELFDSYLGSVFSRLGKGWEQIGFDDHEFIRIVDGDRGSNYPKANEFHDEGHCLFLNTKNVRIDGFNFDSTMFITEGKDKKLGKGKLERNDVVLTTRGTIGNVGLYDADVPFENIRINSGMLILRPNQRRILSSFLFMLLRSSIIIEQIKRHTSGAAQPQLPIRTLVNFTMPVPTALETQLAIVNNMNGLEKEAKALELAYSRKIESLEELRSSILHQAFSGQL